MTQTHDIKVENAATGAKAKPVVIMQKQQHRNAEWWALQCAEREPFNSHIRKLVGRRWSATLNAWLLPGDQWEPGRLQDLFANSYQICKVPVAFNQSPTQTNPVEQKTPRPISRLNQEALLLFHKELVLKGYSPSTIRTYESEFIRFLTLIKGVPAKDFTTERLKDYLYYCHTTLKLSEATLHSKINSLKFYYEQVLHREHFFWEIPRPKKQIQNPSLFNQDQIAALIKGTENIKHKAMLMVAYSAGLRVSEVVALKPTHIDSQRMCLHIEQGKGKKDRMVSLSPVLLVMLREYWRQWKPKPKIWLFEGQEQGTPYSARSLQQVLWQAKKRTGIVKPGSIHALRHSFATHLLDKGADVTLIMKLLGHNDVRTTMRYLHVSNRDLLQIISPLDSLLL